MYICIMLSVHSVHREISALERIGGKGGSKCRSALSTVLYLSEQIPGGVGRLDGWMK